MRLDNIRMIVTGAGQGIGKAIAVKSAYYGADICVVGRNMEKLKKRRKKLMIWAASALLLPLIFQNCNLLKQWLSKHRMRSGKLIYW